MAYRITVNGLTVEADTVEDVRALVGLTRDPPASAKGVRATNTPRARGASPGALDGRILAILREHAGPMAPAALVTACKAPPGAVRAAVAQLAARGNVRVAGATTRRTVTLT